MSTDSTPAAQGAGSHSSLYQCPQCGELNPANAQVCRKCGAALVQPVAPNANASDANAQGATATPSPITQPTSRAEGDPLSGDPPSDDRLPVGEIISNSEGVDVYIITASEEATNPRTYQAQSIHSGARVWLHEAIAPATLPGLMQLASGAAELSYVADLEPAFSANIFGVERWYAPEVIPPGKPGAPHGQEEWTELARQLATGLAGLHDKAGVAYDLTPETCHRFFNVTQGVARWEHLQHLLPLQSNPEAANNDVRALASMLLNPLSNVPVLRQPLEDMAKGVAHMTAAELTHLLGMPHRTPHPTPHPNGPAPVSLYTEIGYATDKGKLRETNEDNFGTAMRSESDQPSLFLAVADGMGGEDAGEVASAMVIKMLRQAFVEMPSLNGVQLNNWVQQSIQNTNELVSAEAQQRQNQMGSTLVMALVHEGIAYLGNVGDSRIYRWNPKADKGRLVRLTQDHSLVQRLVDQGQLSDEARYTHPERNMLLRSIGDANTGKSDLNQPVPLRDGDWLLLCSDGLWEMVRDQRVREILSKSTEAQAACDRLIAEANKNGGEDNITVVIARFSHKETK